MMDTWALEEWKGAYILAKKAIPKTVPTIRGVIRQTVMLGGFLGRSATANLALKRFGRACSGCGISSRGWSMCGKSIMSNELCGTKWT